MSIDSRSHDKIRRNFIVHVKILTDSLETIHEFNIYGK